MKQFNNSRFLKGFTLIELLMVITIISVLTLLATYSYNNVQIKARDAKRKQDVKNVQKALQLYFDDKDTYPGFITADDSSLGPYIPQLPVDPKFGTGYIYSFTLISCPPTCYTITTCLENPNDPQGIVKPGSGDGSTCTGPRIFQVTNPN